MDSASCAKPHGSLDLPLSTLRCRSGIGTTTSSPIEYRRRSMSLVLRASVVSDFGIPYSMNQLRHTVPLLRRRREDVRRNARFSSELTTNAGCSDTSSSSFYTQTEYELASRTRGLLFYVVTAIAAIPLFMVMMIVHPFVILFDRHRRRVHHFIAKLWATFTVSPFYNVEFEGLENLPPTDSPAVYVSNHQSFLDIYTLLTLGRNFKFISKTAIFLIPVAGWAMYLMGLIPLRRMDSRSQLDCLKRCINLVKRGASVFFFPEGTRSKDGKMGPFKKGAFSVAAKTGVPVVPITLLGAGKLMPAGMEHTLNKGSVKIVIHKPIEGSDADKLCKEACETIANTLILHGYGIRLSLVAKKLISKFPWQLIDIVQ